MDYMIIPYCEEHKLPFRSVDGIGGERYIECPKGGWKCKITNLYLSDEIINKAAQLAVEEKLAKGLE